jgi:hypothetical protein
LLEAKEGFVDLMDSKVFRKLGVPILPPYYTLRLLPFCVPLINGWRRRLLRERDLLDAIF